jgi:hypothetical protein
MRCPSRAAWFVCSLFLSYGEMRGEEAPKPAGEVSERDARILELFSASQKSLKDGKLRLVYNFESQRQDLPEDWLPALNPNDMRIRWLRGSEGTPTTVEHGICIGDYGEWMHEAVFLPDGLEVTVDLMNYSPHKPGSICGPVFFNDKKKMSLGASMGRQVVSLKGWKLAKAPHPKTAAPISAITRYKSGFKLHGGVFEAHFNGKKTADSTTLSKLTDGFDRGRVGLAWSGSVQSFIYSVTMEGSLDPEWVAKQLGEATGEKTKAKGAKKKAGKKQASSAAAKAGG